MFQYTVKPLMAFLWASMEFIFLHICFYLSALPCWFITLGKKPSSLHFNSPLKERVLFSVVGVQLFAIAIAITTVIFYT